MYIVRFIESEMSKLIHEKYPFMGCTCTDSTTARVILGYYMYDGPASIERFDSNAWMRSKRWKRYSCRVYVRNHGFTTRYLYYTSCEKFFILTDFVPGFLFIFSNYKFENTHGNTHAKKSLNTTQLFLDTDFPERETRTAILKRTNGRNSFWKRNLATKNKNIGWLNWKQ